MGKESAFDCAACGKRTTHRDVNGEMRCNVHQPPDYTPFELFMKKFGGWIVLACCVSIPLLFVMCVSP